MDNICVYRHRRLDTNEIFYIGVGTVNRAYTKSQRNNIWKNIISKTDYKIEIIVSNLSWKDACELEILLISEYGKIKSKTGTLSNITDGGEGFYGGKHSKETKLKMSKAKIGISTWNKGIIGKENHRYGVKFSKNHKNKISSSLKGRSLSSLHIENLKGKKRNKGKNVINTITKEMFETMQEACEKYSISKSTMSRYLNGSRTNKTNLSWA